MLALVLSLAYAYTRRNMAEDRYNLVIIKNISGCCINQIYFQNSKPNKKLKHLIYCKQIIRGSALITDKIPVVFIHFWDK